MSPQASLREGNLVRLFGSEQFVGTTLNRSCHRQRLGTATGLMSGRGVGRARPTQGAKWRCSSRDQSLLTSRTRFTPIYNAQNRREMFLTIAKVYSSVGPADIADDARSRDLRDRRLRRLSAPSAASISPARHASRPGPRHFRSSPGAGQFPRAGQGLHRSGRGLGRLPRASAPEDRSAPRRCRALPLSCARGGTWERHLGDHRLFPSLGPSRALAGAR
jgi:hypothetical protein